MFYAQLLGGIGNIMFIIATIASKAKDNKTTYCVSNNTLSCTKRDESKWMNTLFKDVPKVNSRPKHIKKMYRERGFQYQKIPNINDIMIHGLYQSAKYFNHNRDMIVKLFTSYREKIMPRLKSLLPKTDKPLVSIHIRRGDYLKYPDVHIVQDITYFKNALKHFNTDNCHFVIFSLDQQWCKSQTLFTELPHKNFITGTTDIEDLYLMSLCQHNIIANSTFSWWGAYLGEQDNRKVIAPKKWLNTKHMPEDKWQDIYCQGWIIEE